MRNLRGYELRHERKRSDEPQSPQGGREQSVIVLRLATGGLSGQTAGVTPLLTAKVLATTQQSFQDSHPPS